MIRSTTEVRTDNTISHYVQMFSPYYVTTNMTYLLHFTPTSKGFLYRILPVTCICKFTKPNFKTRNIYVWIRERFTPTIWQRVNCRITTGGPTIHQQYDIIYEASIWISQTCNSVTQFLQPNKKNCSSIYRFRIHDYNSQYQAVTNKKRVALKLQDVHSLELANLGYSHHYIKTVVLCRVQCYFTSGMLDTVNADNLYKNRTIRVLRTYNWIHFIRITVMITVWALFAL